MGQLHGPFAVADKDTRRLPSENAEKVEIRELISWAVQQLPPDQQEAFMLKFQDGLTYREISSIMDKSLGTVSRLISTALGTIRSQLRTKTDLVKGGSNETR